MSEKIEKLMALHVMGFEYSEEPPYSSTIQRGELEAGKEFATYSWRAFPNGTPVERMFLKSIPFDDWKPTTDMNQAMKCADNHKGDFVSICNTPAGWTILCGRDLIIVVDEVEEVPLAICTAIYKAVTGE